MFQYVVKRILIFIPTLVVVSLVAFSLSKIAPGDPVELLMKGQNNDQGQEASTRNYEEVAQRLGLHLPVFYASLSSAAHCDTLYKVVKKTDRENLAKLIDQYGNWPQISAYYLNLKQLEQAIYKIPDDSSNYSAKRTIKKEVKALFLNYKDGRISSALNSINTAIQSDSSTMVLATLSSNLQNQYHNVKSLATPAKLLIPAIHWHGFNNQYHRWIGNFLQGDFGFSYLDNRPVSNKMWDALRWTLIINVISILIAYLIAIPIGVSTAVRKDSSYDRITTTVLFILYSLPTFWIGTILIVFFTTSEYSSLLNWFPTGGVQSLENLNASAGTKFIDIAHHLVLPIFCVTYGSFAFISRQMRGGMLNVVKQDYIRTARAKGLPEQRIVWKHAFRNSLFPIITLFAYIFPAAIAGSVTIEVIYSIPGMGKLIIDSIVARDWPVVFTILMFAAILTMIGNLIADVLYAVVDPRVSYAK